MIEAQDLNIKQCTKVTIAIQNAWCYCVIYDEQKGATTQMSLQYFFFFFSEEKIELNPDRNQNLCLHHQACKTLKLALCLLLLMTLQLYLLSATSSPAPVSGCFGLFT